MVWGQVCGREVTNRLSTLQDFYLNTKPCTKTRQNYLSYCSIKEKSGYLPLVAVVAFRTLVQMAVKPNGAGGHNVPALSSGGYFSMKKGV